MADDDRCSRARRSPRPSGEGSTVPAGTQVLIPNTFLHRDRERHEYADRFAPERWVAGDGGRRLVVQPLQPRPAGLPGRRPCAAARAGGAGDGAARREVELASPSLDPAKPLPHMLDFFGLRVDRPRNHNVSEADAVEFRPPPARVGSPRVTGKPMRKGASMFKDTQAFSGFSVDDVPRAKEFYEDTLGLDVTEEGDGVVASPRRRRQRVRLPEGRRARTRLVHGAELPGRGHRGGGRAAEGARGRVRALRGDPEPRPTRMGSSAARDRLIAWFKDPAGNVLSVIDVD